MKDAYYFSHDSNAKDDPKCVLLIEQLGLEGYGIFWVLIETLRDQPNYKYPLALIPALARRYNTTSEKMKTVVMQYNLFSITEKGEFFFSESLNRRMESLSIFRESQRKKALKRWSDAPALPRECHGNADPMPVKESKEKKSKVKDSKENILSLFSTYAGKDNELLDALNGFAEMRKAIKKPLSTERAAKMLLSSLDKLAPDSKTKIEILNQSIFKNWQGVFPLKEQNQGAPSKPEKQYSFDIDEYDRTSIYDVDRALGKWKAEDEAEGKKSSENMKE